MEGQINLQEDTGRDDEECRKTPIFSAKQICQIMQHNSSSFSLFTYFLLANETLILLYLQLVSQNCQQDENTSYHHQYVRTAHLRHQRMNYFRTHEHGHLLLLLRFFFFLLFFFFFVFSSQISSGNKKYLSFKRIQEILYPSLGSGSAIKQLNWITIYLIQKKMGHTHFDQLING